MHVQRYVLIVLTTSLRIFIPVLGKGKHKFIERSCFNAKKSTTSRHIRNVFGCGDEAGYGIALLA